MNKKVDIILLSVWFLFLFFGLITGGFELFFKILIQSAVTFGLGFLFGRYVLKF